MTFWGTVTADAVGDLIGLTIIALLAIAIRKTGDKR